MFLKVLYVFEGTICFSRYYMFLGVLYILRVQYVFGGTICFEGTICFCGYYMC